MTDEVTELAPVVVETPAEVVADVTTDPPVAVVVEAEEDEVVITLGAPAEEDQEKPTALVQRLREVARRQEKVIRELQRQLPAQVDEVGAKPTLAAAGPEGYDEEVFADQLLSWNERKRKADERTSAARAEQEQQQATWNTRLEQYGAEKVALKVKDFDVAEDFAREVFSVTQQSVIVKGCANPAAMIYALSKSPAKARELAAEKDPVVFAFKVAKLEDQVQITSKKTAPIPEKAIRANVSGAVAVGDELARLRDEADRTNDRTKVAAYLRKQAAKK